jgi:hypothetical protein
MLIFPQILFFVLTWHLITIKLSHYDKHISVHLFDFLNYSDILKMAYKSASRVKSFSAQGSRSAIINKVNSFMLAATTHPANPAVSRWKRRRSRVGTLPRTMPKDCLAAKSCTSDLNVSQHHRSGSSASNRGFESGHKRTFATSDIPDDSTGISEDSESKSRISQKIRLSLPSTCSNSQLDNSVSQTAAEVQGEEKILVTYETHPVVSVAVNEDEGCVNRLDSPLGTSLSLHTGIDIPNQGTDRSFRSYADVTKVGVYDNDSVAYIQQNKLIFRREFNLPNTEFADFTLLDVEEGRICLKQLLRRPDADFKSSRKWLALRSLSPLHAPRSPKATFWKGFSRRLGSGSTIKNPLNSCDLLQEPRFPKDVVHWDLIRRAVAANALLSISLLSKPRSPKDVNMDIEDLVGEETLLIPMLSEVWEVGTIPSSPLLTSNYVSITPALLINEPIPVTTFFQHLLIGRVGMVDLATSLSTMMAAQHALAQLIANLSGTGSSVEPDLKHPKFNE